MNRCRSSLVAVAALLSLDGCAHTRTSGGLQDLVDVRASRGESELEDRGYDHRKTIKVNQSSIAYWWKQRGQHCVAVTTRDGRYTSIVDQPEAMCDDDRDSSGGHHGGGHSGQSNHGGLGDLVGMRASRGEDELEDRGYDHRKSVELGGGSIDYWWKQRGNHCIAVNTKNGRYISVVDQPEAMCDDDRTSSGGHHGRGHSGQSNHGGLGDLVGMRASSGERELADRGYKFVNSSKGDGRIWANWWSHSKHKCITVVTMDGRYDSIQDTRPADCDRH